YTTTCRPAPPWAPELAELPDRSHEMTNATANTTAPPPRIHLHNPASLVAPCTLIIPSLSAGRSPNQKPHARAWGCCICPAAPPRPPPQSPPPPPPSPAPPRAPAAHPSSPRRAWRWPCP